jgi:UDP-N-acetyl-alpha-D-muramoyl-L-alanyl-L-glutamate epimerase
VAVDTRRAPTSFDRAAFNQFRFTARNLDTSGRVTLRYALDDQIEFVEIFELPLGAAERKLTDAERHRVDGLLALLHWVAGVSYYKTALPPVVSFEAGSDTPAEAAVPLPAAAELLEALYSEGLAELAYTNRLPGLPRPRFARSSRLGGADRQPAPENVRRASVPYSSGPVDVPLGRILVPVGGGKDSAVALEIVRRSGSELSLFSIGDAPPIARTVAAAGLPHLIARRTLDPGLRELNEVGALNGHVPITAVVTCVALLTAALNGFDAVAMANEHSASVGNVVWDGVEVNHQFSKGLRAERLLTAALAEIQEAAADAPDVRSFSVLRPASELAIARAFAGMDRYHDAFTSCNAIFRIDPELRAASWCCDCPKCRFVFLALAPFSEPEHLCTIFGRDLLADDAQFEGFALLTATGGHKPFECVGEDQESLAAIRLLARDPRWSAHSVVARMVAEVLPKFPADAGDPDAVLALSDEHEVPTALLAEVRAVLGA